MAEGSQHGVPPGHALACQQSCSGCVAGRASRSLRQVGLEFRTREKVHLCETVIVRFTHSENLRFGFVKVNSIFGGAFFVHGFVIGI